MISVVLYRNIRNHTDGQGSWDFTLDGIQKLNPNNKSISGYFDSSYTGEKS